MDTMRITGGRVLLPEERQDDGSAAGGRTHRRDRQRGDARGAGIRCARLAGAAGDRRYPWRRVRAAIAAAAGGGFSARPRAGRYRGAIAGQRHHHRLSRHHVVVGAGIAQPGCVACVARRVAGAAMDLRHARASALGGVQSRCAGNGAGRHRGRATFISWRSTTTRRRS